jgi:hypothetical protein
MELIIAPSNIIINDSCSECYCNQCEHCYDTCDNCFESPSTCD